MEALQINKPLPIYGEVRAVTTEQKEQRYHEFILSSESVDRHNTVFRSEGWMLDNYNNTNPIVSYVHKDNDENPDLIIGRGQVFMEDGKVIGRIYYEPEDINPLAEKIRKKVEHGTLRMASILATPFKGHFGKEEDGEKRDVLYFDKQELMSWSIVPLGSNRDALKRSTQAIEDYKTQFTREIEVKEPINVGDQNKNKTLSLREAQLIINNQI